MGQLAFCSLLTMRMLVALTLLALGAATPEAEADPYYGYGSYGLARSYGGYGGYGLSYGGYGGYGLSYGGYGGYAYGKRSADAAPEAEAEAEAEADAAPEAEAGRGHRNRGRYYGRSYGVRRSYGGYGRSYGGYSRSYGGYGRSYGGYGGYRSYGYGKREAEASPVAEAEADPYYGYGRSYGLARS